MLLDLLVDNQRKIDQDEARMLEFFKLQAEERKYDEARYREEARLQKEQDDERERQEHKERDEDSKDFRQFMKLMMMQRKDQ